MTAMQNAKSTLGAALITVEALLTLFVGTSLALLTAIWQPLSAASRKITSLKPARPVHHRPIQPDQPLAPLVGVSTEMATASAWPSTTNKNGRRVAPTAVKRAGRHKERETDLGPDRTQVDRCSATNRRHQSAACASGLIHTIS
jgi:hypothetical protein